MDKDKYSKNKIDDETNKGEPAKSEYAKNETATLSQTPTVNMRLRLFGVVFLLFVLFVGFTGYKLFEVAVIKSEYYKQKANSQQLDVFTLNANRGAIYDRNGKILAQSSTVWNVILSPGDIKDNEDDAKQICEMLSEILDLDYDELFKLCQDTNNRYEIIARKIDKETRDKINLAKDERKIGYYSVWFNEDTMRIYPNASLASNVVGFTNYENEGIYGVEASYDKYLQGRNGKRVILKDGSGKTMAKENEELYEAQDGSNVYTTIDSTLQNYLEKNLNAIIAQHHVANRAAGIMMDPNTGAILAMATTEGYDLNNPSKLSENDEAALKALKDKLVLGALIDNGMSENGAFEALPEEARNLIEAELNKQESVLRETQWRNKAVTELYYPGSVFKVITCASALEEKVVDYSSTFYCPGVVTVADTKIGCWQRGGHGTLDLLGAVTKSCNPSFIDISKRLGASRFYDYFEALGFTERTGVDLPAETRAIVMPRNKMGPVELATSSFGQTNKITPLQMITAYAACVNGGYLVTPRIVDRVVDAEGNAVFINEPQIKRQVLSKETSEQMREILESVVKSNGGSNSYISGYRIGGKSGTSQKIDDYKNDEMRYVASFCAFAPADNPQLILLIIVDEPNPGGEPYYGSTVAAPVVSAVLNESFKYLEFYPQYTAEEQAALDKVVPYIVGLPYLEGEMKLSYAGLEHKYIGEGNTILRTMPPAGQQISRGGTVVVYLEDVASEKTEVPNVYGLTVEQTNRAIADAGLNVRLSGGAIENESATAVLMSIAPETEVNMGTIVEVTFAVNSGFGD